MTKRRTQGHANHMYGRMIYIACSPLIICMIRTSPCFSRKSPLQIIEASTDQIEVIKGSNMTSLEHALLVEASQVKFQTITTQNTTSSDHEFARKQPKKCVIRRPSWRCLVQKQLTQFRLTPEEKKLDSLQTLFIRWFTMTAPSDGVKHTLSSYNVLLKKTPHKSIGCILCCYPQEVKVGQHHMAFVHT
jgi:hypothetical protein